MDPEHWWAEEFKTLRTESLARFRLAQNILSFAVVLIAGTSAFITSAEFAKWTSATQVMALAAISTAFSSLCASYFRHERYVALSATYTESRIYSKTEERYRQPVLGWERFLHTSQKGRRLWASAMLGIWSVPVLLPATGFLAYAIHKAIISGEQTSSASIAVKAALGVAAAGWVAAVTLFAECGARRSRSPRKARKLRG